MLHIGSRLLPEISLIIVTAAATHLVMSFSQTLMHYKLGHHPIGGKFFRNHINFHHTHYSKDHLVSATYLDDEGNNTPFFFIPVFAVGACMYFLLPVDLFVVLVVACAASFYAHVFFDKEYHIEGSRFLRFTWFRRKQELHFVHHRYANSNFGVVHFFWDRVLGTYRSPDVGQAQTIGANLNAEPYRQITKKYGAQ
jgi:Fatty acid hydroxylase